MKCTKCSYISFDYNEICPKCNKDISFEREKMNLPTFRPNPPFLLGSLAGVSKGSEEAPLMDDGPVSPAAQQNIDIELEEPMAAEVSLGEFDDTYKLKASPDTAYAGAGDLVDTVELSGQTTEPEEVDIFLEEEGIQELSIDLEDFDIEEPGPGPVRPEEGRGEEIVLDMDLPSSEATQMEETPIIGPFGADDETNLIDIETLSKDEPEVILEDEVFEDAEEPLDLGEVASAVEDDGERPDLPVEMAEEGAPSLSEGAHIPHGDTVALEREFLGLDLELGPLQKSAETGEPAPEQMSGDVLLPEEGLSPTEEAATYETPLLDATKADDDAALVDLETLKVEEPEVTLEQGIFEDIEEPLDLGEVASAVDEGPEDPGLPAGAPTEDLLAPDEGALLPHGDTLALDRELLGLDLDLDPSEEDTEISETGTLQAPEDEIAPRGFDESFRLDEMASAVEEEFKDLGPLRERPTTELPSSDDGAHLPHGDTLALDRELLGLDLELEPTEDDAEIIEARPEQAPEDKRAPIGLDEPFDQEELESPLLEEKPAPSVQGLSPDDTMALDLEALGLDLDLEEGEETRT
jgi:hypothetical protein